MQATIETACKRGTVPKIVTFVSVHKRLNKTCFMHNNHTGSSAIVSILDPELLSMQQIEGHRARQESDTSAMYKRQTQDVSERF